MDGSVPSGDRRDSNPRVPDPQPGAPTAALLPPCDVVYPVEVLPLPPPPYEGGALLMS